MGARKRNAHTERARLRTVGKISGPNDPERWSRRWLSTSRMTIQASGVLILATVTALLWNHWPDPVDPQVRLLLKSICRDQAVHCHDALVPVRRTVKPTRTIQAGEKILEMPRRLQTWDLDALRDPFVKNELLSARIGKSALLSAAFLAAHLARLLLQNAGLNPVMVEYLDVLPSYDDFAGFHPLLWSEQELTEILGEYTSTYEFVTAFQMSTEDEYAAFSTVSPSFATEVSRRDYQTARLIVMTRSVGIPRPTVIKTFNHAMVPVFDLWNHHAKPNVDFSYDNIKRALVVTAITAIPAGAEVINSYGQLTDSVLFAQYGFVNGDGSGWTQASLALWHKVNLNPKNIERGARGERAQKKQMLRYLQYDDGYESCVDPYQEEAWELKKLKFRYLFLIANLSPRWTVTMPPRDQESLPAAASNTPITLEPPEFDKRKLQFDSNAIYSTCRLISLTHHDYNGNATSMIQANLQKDSFVLPPSSQGTLEYRTHMCVARFVSEAKIMMSCPVLLDV